MRLTLLLILAAILTGCATGLARTAAMDSQEVTDVRAKLSMGSCEPALADEALALGIPSLEQEVAYKCLQDGQLGAVERLLGDYQERHASPPNPDYSAYLLALTDFVRFELAAGDDAAQLLAGRRSHDRLATFVRDYPESAYREEVAPRLEALHEGMASAEYRMAMADIEKGRREVGAARLRYVAREYPRSAAAVDAKRWLEQRVTP